MAKTNLRLQLQVIDNNTNFDNIMIGSSYFNDDVWDIRPFITAKRTKKSRKYLRFEYIESQDMKQAVK
ncbi:hypothetical protein [Clostridium coskatii]|uniref:Uncharacterized protein n=1 Tax=Clostridium coskatii TaxID=1705578 RepID=A0A166SPK0_9CLOT|nr:hypothetical protein [Clostridium coskatii]OAA92611.1 hypothetical protein WX73_00907 [Clostridium coskatii]OBR91540.1 hypothetical protein CLCOS_34600 [Clostridium coskatii]